MPCGIDGLAGVSAIDDRLMPVPLNGTLSVDTAVPLLLVTLMSAVRCPTAEGAEDTRRLQETPAAKVAGGFGQLFVSRKSPVFGPVSETFVNDTAVAPGFFTLIVCDALAV